MRLSAFERRVAYGLKRHRRKISITALVLILIALILAVCIILSHLRPMIVELALATATDVITLTVNDVIADVMQDENVSYGDMVSLEKDVNGNITALVTNMANINALQARITNAVVEAFAKTDVTEVQIPVGNLIGGALLSGRGPGISAKILSVTNVTTSFRNEFSSAGINQTRHQIMIDVDVTLGILLAGYSNSWDNVLTEVAVAETVIVGNVPGTYAEIG